MKNSIFKENEIITRFNHINVVYVFQILEDSENFYIIMEYCKHGELFDYIVKKEKLTEEESSIFFYQLINGIEYIHSKGISHRDLKPENLLLAENKILKIIDFGLSHEFEGDELLKTKCGSPSYAAPEIICCPFYDGFKVDIWCCGIILYAMLCGYLPFEGEDNNLLFQNILNCDPEFPEFLSDLSKDIILQILNPDPETRITIEEIKKHKFYLKGKKLCKIDYENIENNIIKKRNVFGKKKAVNNIIDNEYIEKEKKMMNKSQSNSSENNNKEDLEIINDIEPKKRKYIYETNNNIKIDDIKENDSLDSNENINLENLNKESLKESKNESSSSNNFKKQIMEINSKYIKKKDKINDKIQRILKTDVNDNLKISPRPYSSNKKISTNTNNASLSNNSNINKNKNSKPEQQFPFFNIISEAQDNNIKKNSLFIKLLDSAKNKYFNIYKANVNTDKYESNKTDSKSLNFNINTEITQKQENKANIQATNSFFTNFKNNSPKINLNIKDDNKNNYQNHIISLSNDNLNDLEKQIQTTKNKKPQKFNLFKKSTKPEKIKAKPYFNIKKTLSKQDTNIERNKYKENKKANNNNNIIRKSITSKPKEKQLNLYVPNSTLYYNNININIKELNINSKEPKNTKNNIISSFINNTKIHTQRIKNPSQSKRGHSYKYHYDNKNRIENNKAFSAKRLFTYNINTNDIHNLKTNINSINHTRKNSNTNITINKVNKMTKIKSNKNNQFNENNNNLYTISNSNRHYFLNTMYNNDINLNYNYNYNIISTRKTPKYEIYSNNNMKFTHSEKNINILRGDKILKTESKDIIKKQFSFNRQRKNNNINSKKIRLNSEMNSGFEFGKDIKRRSKSNNIIKSKTINSDIRGDKKNKKGKLEGVNHDFVKKFGTRYNSNNIDEMLLYMFIKQKHNGKSNTQSSFRK